MKPRGHAKGSRGRRTGGRRKGIDIDAILADLRRDYPTPSEYQPLGIDTANRHAAQAYIRGKLMEQQRRTVRPTKRRSA